MQAKYVNKALKQEEKELEAAETQVILLNNEHYMSYISVI